MEKEINCEKDREGIMQNLLEVFTKKDVQDGETDPLYQQYLAEYEAFNNRYPDDRLYVLPYERWVAWNKQNQCDGKQK